MTKLESDIQSGEGRNPGGWEGRVWMAVDFDELPPELLAAFGADTAEG